MRRTMLRVLPPAGFFAGLVLAGALASGCGQTQATSDPRFAPGAFPPTLSDTDYHRNPWGRKDCLVCHEKGVVGAPAVQHRGLPPDLLKAQCQTCHVLAPGSAPRKR